jgi:peptidoglycan/xylan/chitin deacetylase (PgdA/CDA1 family)
MANIRKHGIIFLPYRVGVLVAQVARRVLGREGPSDPPDRDPPVVPCDVLEVPDLHAAEVLARVQAWAPDLGLSVGAPILKPALFRIPSQGTLNLHLGKVPDFRGAPPGFWELHQGAAEIGATVHWINEGLDTGPVVASAIAPVYPADQLTDVEVRVTELGQYVLRRALEQVAAGDVTGRPQEPGGTTFRMPTLRVRMTLAFRRWATRVPRRLGSPAFVAKSVARWSALAVVRPVRDLWRRLARTHRVRVFTFHRVTDLCRDGMTVPPSLFRRQVAYIRRFHDVVSLERALELLEQGARLHRPVAVLTFDDGYASVWERARPVLERERLPGCCFVSTALIDTDRRFEHDADSIVRPFLGTMTWTQVAELRRSGWTIGAHTANHVRLSECHDGCLRRELDEPLQALRQRVGMEGVTLAYPFGQPGDMSEEALEAARRAGYRACFSDFGGDNLPGAGSFAYRRIDIGGAHATLAWKVMVHGFDFRGWRRYLRAPH